MICRICRDFLEESPPVQPPPPDRDLCSGCSKLKAEGLDGRRPMSDEEVKELVNRREQDRRSKRFRF
ncbi:MAG: hypothetical protein UY23_C0006G0023 [Candidatus Jorgensenbacteria bacterium GW2011_GWA1_48_11]|uniref:Uncharacterized protein n=1 Tax=Candidatus Jorgensenbacteria bacterium GW2011_GWA1_48_11 TaxID=1618660 RepID=A0A0G1U9P0_9BACT|nr:MAG: hypothetical protein UY23_C0006G0023 [Candidatus Jorgensenbacteria bacterium GW2011_GWA1_48_11]